ncbi:MAG: DUF2946 domain-containing protein [Rubrivivax sp.]|nr:DUF2946 domain-containing protein [Rubrivivax sp.]
MSLLRHRLRHFTWIALVAMLGLGLLPAVSHALAWAGGRGDWTEVCTARGLTQVAADGSPVEPDGLFALHAMVHCPFCASGTPAAGPPVGAWAVWLEPVGAPGGAPAMRLPPDCAMSWPAAQPRAPPATR